MGDEFQENLIRSEKILGATNVAEALWGGPDREGIVHIVSRLARTVERLAGTVDKLSEQMDGDNGIKKRLSDIETMNKLVSDLAARRQVWIIAMISTFAVPVIYLVYHAITGGGSYAGH
jgi:hypothetical protein